MLFNQPVQRPINTYPAWKYVLVLAVLLICIVYALPNLYGEDPAVQITSNKTTEISTNELNAIAEQLKEKNVSFVEADVVEGRGVIRFATTEEQLEGLEAVRSVVAEDDYVTALNLVPRTPDWLKNLGGNPMKLGLDLRGGVHFLMAIDMDSAISRQREQLVDDIRTFLRENDVRNARPAVDGDDVVVTFADEESRDKAYDKLRRERREFNFITRDGARPSFVVRFSDQKMKDIRDSAVQQNIAVLRKRVNALGVAEPLIQRQGAERIVVQLPGVQDPGLARAILGSTATLELRIVDDERDALTAERRNRAPAGTELLYEDDAPNIPILVKKRAILSGEHINDAYVGYGESGQALINVRLDSEGGSKMSRGTQNTVGKRMAIVLTEQTPIIRVVDGERQIVGTNERKSVPSAPVIRDRLGSQFQITGNFTPAEAQKLAITLRSGALIAPTFIVEERTVGPSLGAENIKMGMYSIQIGFALVLIFMLVYYKVFGLIANIALTANLVLIVAVLSLFPGATLTLPGIAGIVLTVGMAVDANVLIFERIREELRAGSSAAQAIHNGYDKALSTIADANVTTLVAAVILFAVGTGPIKGFAVTLFIGILSSMFTAIMGSRAMVNLIYGGKTVNKLSI